MHSQPTTLTLFALVSIITLTGCSAVMSGLYGIKKPCHVDEKTIGRYSQKYNIPVADCFELDTMYEVFIRKFDSTEYKEQIKNHLQPLQALYYDQSGKMISYHVNCYAGGFPNLKWNRNGEMSTFPPQQQAPLDSILPLSEHLKFLNPLKSPVNSSTENFDYIVVVHWNKFMGRQSKRLIRLVQKNSKLERSKSVKIMYANSDDLFAD